MSNTITVNLDDLDKLVKKGEDIVMSPDAEKALLQLLDLKDKIELAYDEAKLRIEKAALKQDAHFKSVQGDYIKAGYRVFGAKYIVDASLASKISPELIKTKVTHSPDSKAIDGFMEDHKNLPQGISLRDRKPQITLKRLEGWDE